MYWVDTGLYWGKLGRKWVSLLVITGTGLYSYWSIPVRIGPYWSIPVHTGPYWFLLVLGCSHTGPYRSILVIIAPY